MKHFLLSIILALFVSLSIFAEEIVVLSDGQTILVKDDFSWELIELPVSNRQEALLELNYQGIVISVTDCRIIQTIFDETEAGLRFRIKNNSDRTVTKLKVVVYFLDNSNLPFFEKEILLLNAESWTDPVVLKPNYTVLFPGDSDKFRTVDGLDLSEWQEGQVIVEVSEIEYE